MRLWPKKREPRKGFVGDWSSRIGDLFACGVAFRGRTVLDAGCNMGILAYEISKHAPTFIHGIDNGEAFIRTAQMIFLGVAVESRFERIDLSQERVLAAALRPAYDVVLFLSVYHHIRNAHGTAAADGAMRLLLSRCSEEFVLRIPEVERSAVEAVVEGEGFARTFMGEAVDLAVVPGRRMTTRLMAYRRRSAESAPGLPSRTE